MNIIKRTLIALCFAIFIITSTNAVADTDSLNKVLKMYDISMEKQGNKVTLIKKIKGNTRIAQLRNKRVTRMILAKALLHLKKNPTIKKVGTKTLTYNSGFVKTRIHEENGYMLAVIN